MKLQSNGPVAKKAKKETSSSDSSEDSSEEEEKARGLPTQKAGKAVGRGVVGLQRDPWDPPGGPILMGACTSFCSATPAKQAGLPQRAGKAAAKASESSSSEESSEEEEDKKKKPVQVWSLGCKEGLGGLEKKLSGAASGRVVGAVHVAHILGTWEGGDAEAEAGRMGSECGQTPPPRALSPLGTV